MTQATVVLALLQPPPDVYRYFGHLRTAGGTPPPPPLSPRPEDGSWFKPQEQRARGSAGAKADTGGKKGVWGGGVVISRPQSIHSCARYGPNLMAPVRVHLVGPLIRSGLGRGGCRLCGCGGDEVCILQRTVTANPPADPRRPFITHPGVL